MKVKIQKWLKETIYAIGFIFGALYETLKLRLYTKFIYHGEDLTLKDGDFMAYDTKRKTWDILRKKDKD